MRFALPPNDPALTEPEIHSFSLVPTLAKTIEPVGKSYAALQGKFMRAMQREQIRQGNTHDEAGAKYDVEDSEGSEDPKSAENTEERKGEEEAGEEGNQDDYAKKKRTKTKEQIEREALESDYYKILNLEGKNEATAAEINKAYKKITLKYHPDKIAARGQKLTANAKEVWLKIQKAYNTLTDADKRRKYDSSLPFDEAIPKESEVQDAKKFYTLFRECFANNAKFAVSKPVPDIGDADTPMNDVYKFYRYWDSFKTWREFSQYDEYDEEEAQDRYERRWMQNENKRGRKKYEKAERKRIILMGTRAYDNDPRIRAEKLRETEAKAAAKQARKEATEAKWAKVNDGKRLVEEAAAAAKVKAVEDKKAEQQRRKEVRALYKAAQKDLIAFCEEKMTGTKYDRFYVDELVKKYPKQEQLDGLIIKIKAIEATDVPSFQHEFLQIVDAGYLARKVEEDRHAELRKKQAEEKAKSIKGDWTEEELDSFRKAVVKFPTGTINRWKTIADHIGSRNQKEVIAKAKEIQAKQQQAVEEKREAEEDKQARIESYKKEAAQKAKQAAAEAKQEAKEKARDMNASNQVKNKKKAAAAAGDGWTEKQQTQMEKGMKEIPASVPTKERWIKIAEYVEGKPVKEVFARYKELVAKAKASASK